MRDIPYNNKQTMSGENGFSLVVVLFFVGLIATLIAMSVQSQRGAVQRDQAHAAGWHLTQVAKAARIYVRDRSLNESDPYHKSRLQEGGIAIGLASLRAAGLLPENFPDTNVLGQNVQIYAANYPVDGDPSLPETVASAYVFLRNSGQTQRAPVLMQYLVEGARQHGLFVDAPLFSAGGENQSDDCRGSPGYANWGTGCLNLGEVLQVTNQTGFVPGSLLVPSWRADIPDTRAVMRFPQPENTGYATMLTSLEMAPIERNADGTCVEYVQIYDYANGNTPINTGICKVRADDMVACPGSCPSDFNPFVDNSTDIINVSRLTADTIIAMPQTMDYHFRYNAAGGKIDGEEYASVSNLHGNQEVFHVTGDVDTSGNIHATGRIDPPSVDFENTILYPAVSFANAYGTEHRALTVDYNMTVARNLMIHNHSVIQEASAKALNNNLPGGESYALVQGRIDANQIETFNYSIRSAEGTDGENNIFITPYMNPYGNSTSEDEPSYTVNAKSADVLGQAVSSTLAVTATIRPSTSLPAAVIYRAEGSGDVHTSSATIGRSITFGSGVEVIGTTSMTTCAGGRICPDITPPPSEVIDQ